MKEQQLIEMAVNLIRLHHGLGMPEKEEERMWNIYFNCSPEMKPFKEYLESHPAENLVSLQLPDATEMASKRLEKERGKNIELWVDGEQTDYWKEVYCLGVMDERERQLST